MTGTPWWRPYVQAILGAAVGALAVLLTWGGVTVYQVVGDIRDAQKSNQALLEYNKDCDQPSGECFKEREARDAAQVGAFNAAVIAAAWCIKQDPPTRRALTACVGKILDGRDHQ
jgi:hypothetical protein